METANYSESDPEIEKASGMWMLKCECCFSRVGFAWRDPETGLASSLCWPCGSSMQEALAEGPEIWD